MDEKTLAVLTELAAKLGTTTEYLWGVLLKQARIRGITGLIIMTLCIAMLIFCTRFVYRKTATPLATKENPFPSPQWDEDEACVLVWGILIFAWFATIVCAGIEISNGVTAFLNPAYWALQQILEKL